MNIQTKTYNFIQSFSELSILIGLLGGLLVLCYQILQWLKTGQWQELSLQTLFYWLNFDQSVITDIKWVGVKKIVLWVLNLPLSLMVIVLGCFIHYILEDIKDTYL